MPFLRATVKIMTPPVSTNPAGVRIVEQERFGVRYCGRWRLAGEQLRRAARVRRGGGAAMAMGAVAGLVKVGTGIAIVPARDEFAGESAIVLGSA